MSAIDYEEWVEIVTTSEDSDEPPGTREITRATKLGPMPLWRAVRMVLVDWAPSSRRQMGAQILRDQGASLMDLGAIQTVYDQDDFPAKRDRGWQGRVAA
ncbi:hypothetical protein GCM10007874_15860 [Labrys miyagiensis]|uniref:Uncharacterized protein n=1 Tax=Labrys miyagiensis TaxID=346912 RepID=A0ABQ6CIM8_9HYPH|nr:hypothetical protein [Labrys miyagiensis]GLS18569.1 hypothetical protein GCM10007874_15860 [Labrys miyagiensis]